METGLTITLDTGIASVTWDGNSGSPYVLDYNAHVPVGDPSGFGGVPYSLHLEGVVILPGTPPSTNPDQAKTIIGNAITINVLDNDSSADGLDTSSVAIVTPPANGTGVANLNGTTTYTPNTGPDFIGMDSYQYTVDSLLGITSAPTSVGVEVQNNVAPVAGNTSINISTAQLDNSGGAVTVNLTGDNIVTDVNNGPDLPGGVDSTSVTIVSDAAIVGTCTANNDGTITYSQTPPTIGVTESCTYKVSDLDTFNPPLESNIGTVNIEISTIQSDWPAALPTNVIPFLNINPGIPGNPNDTSVPALGGSYFTMQVSAQTTIYTTMNPGPAGGVVVDHEQPVGISHTGNPTGSEQTAIELGWNFFGNTGFTMSKNGGITGNPDGTLQFAGAGGIGNSQGRWLITWNGIPEIDLGGSKAYPQDLGFGSITCNPAPCADKSTFVLNYATHVPPGDPSGFGGVPYTLTLEGTVRFINDQPKTSNGNITTFDRMSASSTGVTDSDVAQQCVGDCFDFTINNVNNSSISVVLPLAGGVPLNPIWRILDNGVWRSFDTSGGDTIKSAPLGGNDIECPDPGDPAYVVGADGKPITGNQCIQLTIADNGPNDKNPAIGTITDPSGMGGGGTAGGGVVASGNRSSSTSGCSIAYDRISPTHCSEWYLLGGFIGWLGWRRMNKNLL